MSLAITGLMRNRQLPLWRNTFWIVPPSMLDHAIIMQVIFHKFLQHKRDIAAENPEPTTYHEHLMSAFDAVFKYHAAVIVDYIVKTPEL